MIFLFFGWFKQTEYDKQGRLIYKSYSPDLHIVYGYLQVGEIYHCNDVYHPYVKHHAHANGSFINHKNNALYVARKTCSLNENRKRADCFKCNPA